MSATREAALRSRRVNAAGCSCLLAASCCSVESGDIFENGDERHGEWIECEYENGVDGSLHALESQKRHDHLHHQNGDRLRTEHPNLRKRSRESRGAKQVEEGQADCIRGITHSRSCDASFRTRSFAKMMMRKMASEKVFIMVPLPSRLVMLMVMVAGVFFVAY